MIKDAEYINMRLYQEVMNAWMNEWMNEWLFVSFNTNYIQA